MIGHGCHESHICFVLLKISRGCVHGSWTEHGQCERDLKVWQHTVKSNILKTLLFQDKLHKGLPRISFTDAFHPPLDLIVEIYLEN